MAEIPGEYSGPGLVDIQVNGYGGVDFNAEDVSQLTADGLHHVRTLMTRRGVVAAFPTLITDDTDLIVSRLRRLTELLIADRELGEFFPRFHLEGPFISPSKPRGAHPEKFCVKPDRAPRLHRERVGGEPAGGSASSRWPRNCSARSRTAG